MHARIHMHAHTHTHIHTYTHIGTLRPKVLKPPPMAGPKSIADWGTTDNVLAYLGNDSGEATSVM